MLALVGVIALSSVWVQWNSTSRIGTNTEQDWVIVLGDRVRDGEPSDYLRERLDTAVSIVEDGRAQRVLISGHAASIKGNEVAAMHEYLVDRGIDAAAITEDEHGVTTYNTCARAHAVFGIDNAIIVTQDFHLRRAVALCEGQGIGTVGEQASADAGAYLTVRNWFREIVLSRPKALLDSTLDPVPRTLEL
ncbi:YdcF family protein [Hoyosella rhizosphaerae]|uniref:Membrane protein n=1 Tax=Hoyosella rhizosphaerae TaxID=1755582 RepID=A0A916UCI0_9ACTN|nr:YdcF family protein [Hoyosella rhizosphaerae]GGC67498.1 membrane protein [Hoyosella rhizosphaerae]